MEVCFGNCPYLEVPTNAHARTGAAVPDNAFETKEGGRTDFDRDTSAHALDPQMRAGLGIHKRTLLLSGNH